MAFYSWFGVFGLTLAVAPAVAFIPRDKPEDDWDIQYISEGYDELSEELEDEETKRISEVLFKKMDDYSFRIFLPCAVATGWILDYEIPANENDYPTKWYIATNAHVANKFRFSKESSWKDFPTEILEEGKEYANNKDFELNTQASCDATLGGYFDFNLSKKSNGQKLRSNYGAMRNKQMSEPKLFYVPINFLEQDKDTGVKENNYRDFAVIEVEFTNLDYAKELTGEFYKKYKLGSADALNVFARPLNERKSWEEIEKSYENYFSLAYSWRNDRFSYETNFNTDQGIASLLSESTSYRPVKGHVSAAQFDDEHPDKMVQWGDKKLNSLGYFYSLEHNSMSGGASGGLVVDRDGNVLGIRSLGNSTTQNSYIVPLRSNRIIKKGAFESPEYDLIVGVAGQKTSYKGEVEKHGRKTYLRKSGWKHFFSSKNNITRSTCFGR